MELLRVLSIFFDARRVALEDMELEEQIRMVSDCSVGASR